MDQNNRPGLRKKFSHMTKISSHRDSRLTKSIVITSTSFYKYLILIDNMQINGNHKFKIWEELNHDYTGITRVNQIGPNDTKMHSCQKSPKFNFPRYLKIT